MRWTNIDKKWLQLTGQQGIDIEKSRYFIKASVFTHNILNDPLFIDSYRHLLAKHRKPAHMSSSETFKLPNKSLVWGHVDTGTPHKAEVKIHLRSFTVCLHVTRCVPMFRDFSCFSAKDWVLDEAGGFLKSTTQNCRFGIFWEAKTILGLLQPTPNQHRQPDQVLSSFISKELRSPPQELLHFWSHHRALHPKHPVTFGWNIVQHSVIELHAKLCSVLSASNGKTLWVQEVPEHQALLFIGTSKCSLTGVVKTVGNENPCI